MRRLLSCVLVLLTSACATAPDAKSDPSKDVQAPVLVHRVNPEYPAELRQQGVTGAVTIEGTVDQSGALINPRVVNSSDSRLESLALDAVRKWAFKPGTLNGQPVDVIVRVDVTFSIR